MDLLEPEIGCTFGDGCDSVKHDDHKFKESEAFLKHCFSFRGRVSWVNPKLPI